MSTPTVAFGSRSVRAPEVDHRATPARARTRARSRRSGASSRPGSDRGRAPRRRRRGSASPGNRRPRGGSASRTRAARPRSARSAVLRRRSPCSGVMSALCVTSRPIMVTSRPLGNTVAAASGSAQMLNSAAGVTFPSAIAPPMRTIRSSLDAASSWRSRNAATFVRGPVGMSVTGCATQTALRDEVAASAGSGARRGSGGPDRRGRSPRARTRRRTGRA